MYGTIKFDSMEKLVEFLKEFSGNTALFKVEEDSYGNWILTFTGGY